jgi:hypothetical protein
VQFPLPAQIFRQMDLHSGRGIAIVRTPDEADYILAGRYSGGRLEYAWLHQGASANRKAELPRQTDWKPANANTLRDAVRRLARIHAWLTLESPPGKRSPYTLIVRRARDRSVVDDGRLMGGEKYGLALRRRPHSGPSASRRYVYVFTIDSNGRSVLLYPIDTGSVENRFPSTPGIAEDIPLGPPELFRTIEPYGLDPYVLLTSDEALADPSILNFDGVRTSDTRGGTPLERLLLQIDDPTRGTRVIRTPPEWSVERFTYQTMSGSSR